MVWSTLLSSRVLFLQSAFMHWKKKCFFYLLTVGLFLGALGYPCGLSCLRSPLIMFDITKIWNLVLMGLNI